MGCATRYVSDEYTLEATRGLLTLCITAPEGEVGGSNDSLAKAFLRTRVSLRVCQGIAHSILSNTIE